MWAHYAESHSGFLLEFDSESSFFKQQLSPEDKLRKLRKVHYSSKRPSLTFQEANRLTDFLTKSREWSYEREWRMIRPLQEATVTIKAGHEAIHLFSFPPNAIRSITFGARVDASKTLELRRILAESNDYRHVVCLQARLSDRHYALTRVIADA